jgi:hypothetical protein
MKIHFLSLVAAMALSACANISSSYKFDPTSEDGLIVGSITYDSSIGLYALAISPPPSAGRGDHRGKVGQVFTSISVAPPRDLYTKFLHQSAPARRGA